MTLQVEQRLADDVADLRLLPGLDPHVGRIVPEALDVVELARRVDRGPGVPELAVVGELAVVCRAHRRFAPRALIASITVRCARIAVISAWSYGGDDLDDVHPHELDLTHDLAHRAQQLAREHAARLGRPGPGRHARDRRTSMSTDR